MAPAAGAWARGQGHRTESRGVGAPPEEKPQEEASAALLQQKPPFSSLNLPGESGGGTPPASSAVRTAGSPSLLAAPDSRKREKDGGRGVMTAAGLRSNGKSTWLSGGWGRSYQRSCPAWRAATRRPPAPSPPTQEAGTRRPTRSGAERPVTCDGCFPKTPCNALETSPHR